MAKKGNRIQVILECTEHKDSGKSGTSRYITTKNKSDLEKRLLIRNQDSHSEVEKRLKSFDQDIKHWSDYDYIVINENLENCFRHVERIIQSHKSLNFPIS